MPPPVSMIILAVPDVVQVLLDLMLPLLTPTTPGCVEDEVDGVDVMLLLLLLFLFLFLHAEGGEDAWTLVILTDLGICSFVACRGSPSVFRFLSLSLYFFYSLFMEIASNYSMCIVERTAFPSLIHAASRKCLSELAFERQSSCNKINRRNLLIGFVPHSAVPTQ
jgi:hypothetical protein